MHTLLSRDPKREVDSEDSARLVGTVFYISFNFIYQSAPYFFFPFFFFLVKVLVRIRLVKICSVFFFIFRKFDPRGYRNGRHARRVRLFRPDNSRTRSILCFRAVR